MKYLTMDTKINKLMNKAPLVAESNLSKNEILSLMRRKNVNQIPLLDKNRRIVGLETIREILKEKKIDNPVFLMAGGFGKRLAPLTNKTPKPLLKVGNKPILET